ncbi:sensor histidine kinase [Clostridium sp. C2-6-12]|uniref:sensor histidine kinase n=1 Tax=Clostridium sp. C2-6-12 TaxID=2698832 RepID=UPI001FAD4B71|nr:sensor histidine kinase [Clostridium sp. C2-6-12]
MSIKKLTLFIFVIMYIIFFIITSFNLYSYSNYEFNKTEKLLKNFNISLSQQIIEKFNNISDISKYPLLIPDTNKLHSILSSSTYYDIDDFNYLKNICDMMLIQNDTINGTYIYDIKGRGIFSTRNSLNNKLKNPSLENWFINTLDSDDATVIIPNITANNIFESTASNTDHLIGFTRKIIDIRNQKINGILLITFSADQILNLLKNDLPFNDQIVSLYDSNGKLIINTNDNSSTFIPSYKQLHSATSIPDIQYINNNIPFVVSCNTIPTTNWIMVNSIPKADVYHIDSLYIISFINTVIFFLIFFVSIYIFFIKRIFNPIKSLISNMERNIEVNLDYKFSYNKNDEIGILIKSYNEMKNRISDLININYKNQIEQKELELKQLQNQINPHFIYNTLESIRMMAEINDDLETSTMSEYFGSIIRYSMNRKINTVLLKDEIDIIENYIYVQKIRFDQIFKIENLITPEVINCEIIKMIIQPLIENSIYHGLSECTGNGKIIIQGLHVNDNLVLTISDNGIGIDEDNLKRLNDYINDMNNDFKGIALRNINKRLKLNYGDEYGLEIFSILGKGTSMVLTLPYIIK